MGGYGRGHPPLLRTRRDKPTPNQQKQRERKEQTNQLERLLMNSTKRIDLVCDWSPGPRAKAASEANEINNWNEKRIIDGMRRSGVGQLDYSLLGVMGRRPLCRATTPLQSSLLALPLRLSCLELFFIKEETSPCHKSN